MNFRLNLIRKLAQTWLNNYDLDIDGLISLCLNSEDYTENEKKFIVKNSMVKPYNFKSRLETAIFRESLCILPFSGLEYSFSK